MAKTKHIGNGKFGFREHDLTTNTITFNWYETRELRNKIFINMKKVKDCVVKKVDRK